MRNCGKCGKDKADSEFGINRVNESGFQCYCRLCMSLYAKAKRQRSIASRPVWVRKTADLSAYQKAYQEANKDRIKEASIARYKENPEKFKEYNRRSNEKRAKLKHGQDY